jgi:hypothetical protein
MIPDWVLSAIASATVTGIFAIVYFFIFYLGRHPDRAILALRETRHVDEKRLKDAAALFEAMDHTFEWPQGFEKCQVDDNGVHLTAIYEDGHANCYYCGVVAKKLG